MKAGTLIYFVLAQWLLIRIQAIHIFWIKNNYFIITISGEVKSFYIPWIRVFDQLIPKDSSFKNWADLHVLSWNGFLVFLEYYKTENRGSKFVKVKKNGWCDYRAPSVGRLYQGISVSWASSHKSSLFTLTHLLIHIVGLLLMTFWLCHGKNQWKSLR